MKIRSAVAVGIISALVGLFPQAALAQEAPIERDPHLEDVPLRVRLEFLVLPHNGKPLATPAYVQQVVARANEIYRSWNMQFDFDPATDFQGFPDAAAYNRNPDALVVPTGVSIDTTALALNREARRHPGKAVIWVVTTGDGGYSNTDGDYVFFRFRRGAELRGDAFFLAHECGHFFGLWHTFDGASAIRNYLVELQKDPVKNAAALKPEAVKEKIRQILSERYTHQPGINPLLSMNSHRMAPFDPGPEAWTLLFPDDPYQPGRKLELTLDPPKGSSAKPLNVTIAPDLTNMMSYYGGGHTLPSDATAAQRAEIRNILLRGTRSHLLHTGIVNGENGHAYFFKADRYISYDLRSNHAEAGYPAPIRDTWEIPFQYNVDAGFVVGSRAYFFRGTTYVEFDLEKNALDPACLVSGYAPTMAEHWKGWPAAWKDRTVDAAANWHDGKVYFFSGAECLRYDLAASTVDAGYPKKIVEEFPRLPFPDYLDGVILTSADSATFFSGNEACRYSPRERRVLEDPQDIRGAWPRVPASGLQGALYTGHQDADFFHQGQMLHYNPLRREVRKTTVPVPLASHWHLVLDHPAHCANWIDGQAIFFQGGQAQWCDLKTGNAAGAPQAFSQRFRNWPKDWEQAGPQAALVWNDGTAFFFKDTQVLTVDIASGAVTHPPQRIAALWSGWPANWTKSIDAVLPDWGEGEKGVIHFFSGSEFLELDVATQSVQGRSRKITAGQWPGLVWE